MPGCRDQRHSRATIINIVVLSTRKAGIMAPHQAGLPLACLPALRYVAVGCDGLRLPYAAPRCGAALPAPLGRQAHRGAVACTAVPCRAGRRGALTGRGIIASCNPGGSGRRGCGAVRRGAAGAARCGVAAEIGCNSLPVIMSFVSRSRRPASSTRAAHGGQGTTRHGHATARQRDLVESRV